MGDGINDADHDGFWDSGYYYGPSLSKEKRRQRKLILVQLRKLLNIETTLRKRAAFAAKPFLKQASKVHRDWVKLYNKLERIK